MLYRKLYSYLRKWMKVHGNYKNNLLSRYGNRIVKNYYNNVMVAFTRWRKQVRMRD